MQGGDLRHVITLLKPTGAIEPNYGSVLRGQFVEFATVRAKIEPTTGKEVGYTDQTLAESTHKVTIRYIKGVNQKMQVHFKGRYFNILGKSNWMERNIYIEMLCVETPVAGA